MLVAKIMSCSSVFGGFNYLVFLAFLFAGVSSVVLSSVAQSGEVWAPVRALKALPDADSDTTRAGTALLRSHLSLSEKQLPLVAHLDGEIHFVDLESGRSRWSFKSGSALTSSYRRPVNDGDDNNCSSGLGGKCQSGEARFEGDTYIYCGEDWDLYVHSRNKGSTKMLFSPEEFVSVLPLISDTGEVILGSKKTTAFLVNERDGKLIHRYGSENDSDDYDDKAIVKVRDDYPENLAVSEERTGAQIQPSTLEPVKPIFITRTDYSFTSYTPSKNTLWNVTIATIQATYLCQKSPNGYAGVEDIAGELNQESRDGYKNPFKCQATFPVSRSRHPKIKRDGVTYLVLDKLLPNEPAIRQYLPDNGNKNLEALRVLEKHRLISYLQTTALSPYLLAGQWTNKGLEALRALEKNKILPDLQVDPSPYFPDKGNPLALLTSDEKVKINMLKRKNTDASIEEDPYGAMTVYEPKLPAVQVEMIRQEVKDPDSRKDMIHMLLAPVIFVAMIILLAILVMVFLNIRDRGKQSNTTNKSPVTNKKRKSKKGGNAKSTMMTDMQDKFTSTETLTAEVHKHAYLEKIDNESPHSTMKGNEEGMGRTIGNLFVSNVEIAKGSNGTVVLEGTYNGRLAAIKRLVRAHSNVASKEVEALLRSDNHPNIVRWYGVEYDPDFVYLALERCTCSLGDLVELYAPLSQDGPSVDNAVSNIKSGPDAQVELINGIEGIELWKKNGYPSTQLLGLMRGIVSGLAHLHGLKIIHRDLKPQNVLISAGEPICAKLSDMGISKSLSDGKSSLTTNCTGAGSSGWQAPELLLGGSQTFALDLFSLGCVLFFCITKGRHPFGRYFERDTNVVRGQLDLSLVEYIPEAVHLFSQLLQLDPSLRPLAHKVLLHPLFWSSEMRLSFLRDSSDRIELEDREKQSDLLVAIECIGPGVFGENWEIKFDSVFLGSIGNHRRYSANSTRHLLRLIRNKWNHYIEFPKQIQKVIGDTPYEFDDYLTKRFPKLLIEVYKVIHGYCREENYFVKYFESRNR